jgi:hypothetical protein
MALPALNSGFTCNARVELQTYLSARRTRVWISQGIDRVSTASGGERIFFRRPPLPLAALIRRNKTNRR